MSSSVNAQFAPEDYCGPMFVYPREALKPILMGLPTAPARKQPAAVSRGRAAFRRSIEGLQRAIRMQVPGRATVPPSKGKPSPLIDPSNQGAWGEVDKELTFKSLNRLLALASPDSPAELPRCTPTQIGAVLDTIVTAVEKAEGKTSGNGWDEAFENAPTFNDVEEPTSINMALKPRDRREARRLRGLPVIRMAVASANDVNAATAGDWGDIDLDTLFPAINRLIQLSDQTGGEFCPCKPRELGAKLSEAADIIEKAAATKPAAEPMAMRLKSNPGRKAAARGFTAADRAAARRLRGLPTK